MESLFDAKTAQVFVGRINKLTPQTQPLWGKMRVDQMLAHCQAPLQIASGQLSIKVNPVIKFLFAKGAKKQMTNEEPVKKNLPTFNEAKIAGQREFKDEQQKLIRQVENFQEKGPAGLRKDAHPFFGQLTVAEWNAMQVKHLDHHLKQFGV